MNTTEVDEEGFWFEGECGFDDDQEPCSWCGGEGVQENDDPLWWGFDRDWIPCECCGGTGLRSHQTIF
jgi:DnaJ-class molecular chaperone